MIWFALRGRRGSLRERSKLVMTSARQQTFAAAMGQFEEQFTAAKVVTEATRPLNLYYGLAQAGMAIAAAHADDPWSFRRHGLQLTNRESQLADMIITPEGEGGFQKVATATGSPLITGPVTLGALWASIPELDETGHLPGFSGHGLIPLLASDSLARPTAQIFPSDMPTDRGAWLKRFAEITATYPGLAGCAIPAEGNPVEAPERPGQTWVVDIRWPAPDPSKGTMSPEEHRAFFDKIAPEHRYHSSRFLRPAINSNPPPSPLMTWWALLYSFSILARYEPRVWTKLLDLDKPTTAVLLQYALTEALTAVPQLVLGALDRQPYLLGRPMTF